MFSCEFCEISKNNFSYRTPPVAASGKKKWHKFRNRLPAPEKQRDNNPLLSDYINNAFNRNKGNDSNETIQEKKQ